MIEWHINFCHNEFYSNTLTLSRVIHIGSKTDNTTSKNKCNHKCIECVLLISLSQAVHWTFDHVVIPMRFLINSSMKMNENSMKYTICVAKQCEQVVDYLQKTLRLNLRHVLLLSWHTKTDCNIANFIYVSINTVHFKNFGLIGSRHSVWLHWIFYSFIVTDKFRCLKNEFPRESHFDNWRK